MRRLKRTLSLLLTFAMLLGICVTTSYAVTDPSVDITTALVPGQAGVYEMDVNVVSGTNMTQFELMLSFDHSILALADPYNTYSGITVADGDNSTGNSYLANAVQGIGGQNYLVATSAYLKDSRTAVYATLTNSTGKAFATSTTVMKIYFTLIGSATEASLTKSSIHIETDASDGAFLSRAIASGDRYGVRLINGGGTFQYGAETNPLTATLSYPNSTVLDSYTGTQASEPTVASKKGGSVTLDSPPVTGETVEYAYGADNSAPTSSWQDSPAFTGLAEGSYYFFARVKETDLHVAGTAAVSSSAVTVYAAPSISYTNQTVNNYTDAISVSPAVTGSGSGSLTYSILPALPSGMSLNSSTGEISGTPSAALIGSSYTVTAADSETQTGTAAITFSKAASVVTSCVISGPDSVAIPGTGETTKTYTAAAYDQFGDVMTGQTFTWTAVPTTTGATINTSTGVLTVPQSATPGSIALSASVDGTSPAVTGSKTVTISAKAAQTLSFADSAKTAAYGDAAFTVTATHAAGDGAVTYASDDTDVATVNASTGAVTIVGAGSATITATAAETADYAPATDSYTLTVGQKEVGLTWSGDANLVYNGSAKNITAAATGLVGGDTCTVTVSGGTETDAGAYTATATGLSNPNYKLPTSCTHAYAVAQMPVNVVWSNNTGLTYNGGTQGPSASASGVGGASLSIAVSGAQTNAGTDYTATVALTDDAAKKNYVLSNASIKFSIGKATVSITDTAESLSILANDAANTGAAALKTKMALPATVTISGAGSTTSTAITWADAVQMFNIKGNTYTYVGTLDANSNFTNRPTLTATLHVAPVTVKSITVNPSALTKAKSEVANAASLTALGLPATVDLTFDQGVTGQTVNATWDTTLTAVQDAARDVTSSQDKTVYVTLTNACFPAWASYSGVMPPCTITITDKFPVAVAFNTPVGDITYGGTLDAPIGAATDSGHGVDAGATWQYVYTGTTAAGAAYGPTETAPTDAGTYTVTANYVSDTHYGSAQDGFTIAKKEIGLTWSGNTGLTYDKTAKNVTAAATGLVGADVCAVTVTGGAAVNAGTYTATAAALSNPNYVLPAAHTQAYSIAKADRALTVNPAAMTLVPGSLTGSIAAGTTTDLDKSAVIAFSSSYPSAVTVSNAGTVSAVGNGNSTITVSIPATANYKAATAGQCTVTAVVKPVTAAAVTGGTDDQMTAAVSGTTITVNGFITAGADLTVTPTRAAGVTGDSTVTITGVTQEKLTAGTTYAATIGGSSVAYTVVTSGVVLLPANVDVAEGTPQPAVPDGTDHDAILDALQAASGTGTSGLGGAAAGTALGQVLQKLSEMAQTLQESFGGDAYTVVVSPFVKMNVTGYTAGANLTLDITPYFTAQATSGGHDPVSLLGETHLENSGIGGTITVTIAKGGMSLPTTNLFARHRLGTNLFEYLPVTYNGGRYSFNTGSFSEFELMSDTRSATINFQYEDGSVRTVTYDASGVGTSFETLTKSGSIFNGWKIDGTNYTGLTDALLTAENGKTITATPSFSLIPSVGGGAPALLPCQITVTAGTGGTVSPGSGPVDNGSSAVFTIKPDSGYRIADVLVDGKSVGAVNTYTFSDVTAAHTISATFVKGSDVSDIFTDIGASTWCHDAVQYVYDAGLMNGVTVNAFAPGRSLNRGMWATMLYRLAGSPAVSGASTFSDVTADTWCADAVIWASRNGIANGMGDGTFRPNTVITRQQLMALLYRYAQYMNYDTGTSSDLGGFTDASQVWAADAVKWALGRGIMNGMTNTRLAPNGSANRGQAATFLMRFMSEMAK